MMFSPCAIAIILKVTNKTHSTQYKPVNKTRDAEAFDIGLLATQFEFRSNVSLWLAKPTLKYKHAAHFGQTEIDCGCCDEIWSYLRFAKQP
jgi:hypothetical protein